MKFFRIFLLLCSVQSMAQTLSPEARVSLLTISPGEELYSTFGHSAIRISDPAQLIDVNYNYGTFDFNAPGFYIKFLRGYLNYLISSHNSYVEMEYWNRTNRLITEQVLNLSPAQKQKMFEYLENNLRPENRAYRYKFFTDNCSTRLRDVLRIACGDSLVFDQQLNADSTYRQWIDKYAYENGQQWADFGMDLAIGTGSDQKTGWSDAMFIPDNLMKALDAAYIQTAAGKSQLVLSKRTLNQIRETEKNGGVAPAVFFLVLMLLTVAYTIWQYVKGDKSLWFDKGLFTLSGIAGWILVLLWWGTDHGVTRDNLNLLWASPLTFPAIYYVGKRAWANWVIRLYALVLVAGWLYIMLTGKSTFSVAVVMIILILTIRLVFILRNVQFKR